jgi:hypothetical protein
MPRQRLHLISWISLAAYFVANTPTALVLGAPAWVDLAPECQACQTCGRQPPGAANHLGPRCTPTAPRVRGCKCCARLRHQVPNTTPQGPQDHRHECGGDPCLGSPAESSNPSCPGCPEDPSCPCCPCPGGCAFCSVAKVPCLSPLTFSLAATFGSGERLAEKSLLYFPPPSAKLIRPPRS